MIVWVLLAAVAAQACVAQNIDAKVANLERMVQDLNKKMTDSKKSVETMTRQMMLQQLFVEERIRSEGGSGVKQVRGSRSGTKVYHGSSHTGKRLMAVHDHANNIRTVGMGEFIAVMNGVEFRTRHNDYGLRMPHRTSKAYHAVEDIPYPDVPPAVLAKKTVDEQIKEMRLWFDAFKQGYYKKRDYRKYFKPVLCYLEGAWTKSAGKIDEPFFSDRHQIDASSWMDLQDKIRFTAFSGRKSNDENLSYLPTTVQEMINGKPVFAQWNYRILCHPLSRFIELRRLRLVDDLAARMMYKREYKDHYWTRAARFELNPKDRTKWADAVNTGRTFLDELMHEIPGKDNYPANLTDDAFNLPAIYYRGKLYGQPINAGKYHRWFKVMQKDAMGSTTNTRGYSDSSIWMAMTEQPKVAGMGLTICKRKQCTTERQRWTYAIPLEIVYLTPLYKWNPYNLQYKGTQRTKLGRTVTLDGRNGGLTPDKALNGTNSKWFYQTPVAFFTPIGKGNDKADTAKGAIGVLDPKGTVRHVTASGTRIVLPDIPGVGRVRTRYPIVPVHGEGSAVWKEVAALKDIVLRPNTNRMMYFEEPKAIPEGQKPRVDVTYETAPSTRDPPGLHTHTIIIGPEDMDDMKAGQTVSFTTSHENAHDHNVGVAYRKVDGKDTYVIVKCDGKPTCWDGHAPELTVSRG